jgi:imidazolonepropionase-like amidohydrolase
MVLGSHPLEMRVAPLPPVASTRLVTRLKISSLEGIKAALLIPGRGQPIPDGALVMDGGQIAWVGQQAAIPARYQQIRFTQVPVLMPGLWDCHQHFMGQDPSEGRIRA